jgi:hypothetical protein
MTFNVPAISAAMMKRSCTSSALVNGGGRQREKGCAERHDHRRGRCHQPDIFERVGPGAYANARRKHER